MAASIACVRKLSFDHYGARVTYHHFSCNTFPFLLQIKNFFYLSTSYSTKDNSLLVNSDSMCDIDTNNKEADFKERRSAKFFKKILHNRVLTDEEQLENLEMKENFLKCDSKDLFGKADSQFNLSTTLEDKSLHRKINDIHSKSASENIHRHTIKQSNITSLRNDNSVKMNYKSKKFINHPKISMSFCDQFGTLVENNFTDKVNESRSSVVGSHNTRLTLPYQHMRQDATDVSTHDWFQDDEDEDWRSDILRLSVYNRKHIPNWYGRRILKYGRRGEVRRALDTFDQMLNKDRVMPTAFEFTAMISVLGRIGYTKKAFALFNMMKKMGIQPHSKTYTALFNACANSPWQDDGHRRAENLCLLMEEQEINYNYITGKAMMKAFAICGNIRRAFSLMDSLSKNYQVEAEAFSFLLMACVSDKETGLLYAIRVWRLMLDLGMKPDLPLYNLLLRCVRDCGVGAKDEFQSVINQFLSQVCLPQITSHNDSSKIDVAPVIEKVYSSEETVISEHVFPPEIDLSNSLHVEDNVDFNANPNVSCENTSTTHTHLTAQYCAAVKHGFLSPSCDMTTNITLSDFSIKENRLMLFGGVDGFLEKMKKDGTVPNVITFCQLISVAMPTVEAENEVLGKMSSCAVKPDIDLVNTLIHKRCLRSDFAAAKEAEKLIVQWKLVANQHTYGILAMTCRHREDAVKLLSLMEESNMAPNIEILGTLMAASGVKFAYKLWILRQAQALDLTPNKKFIENVERNLNYTRQKVVEAERNEDSDSFFLSSQFQDRMHSFVHRYERWLTTTEMQQQCHPWASFKPLQDETVACTSSV